MEFNLSEFGSVFAESLSNMLGSMISLAGLVFVFLGASKYKTFQNDRQMKNMFLSGSVLHIAGVALPILVWFLVFFLGIFSFTTNKVVDLVNIAFINTAIASTVMMVFASVLKLIGCALLITVFIRMNKKPAPVFATEDAQRQEPSLQDEPMQQDDPLLAEEVQTQAPEEPSDGVEQDAPAQETQQESPQTDNADGYMSIATLIVLWAFTFGIGYIYWAHRMTKYFNRVSDAPPKDPVAQCLLCGFVPYYSVYWFYVHTQKLEKLLLANGKREDLMTLLLILSAVCPIAAMVIMQDHCNKLAGQ